jgi:hypothetical protein
MKYAFRTFLSLSLLLQADSVRAQEKANATQSEIGQSLPFELTAGFLISIKGRIGQLDGLQFILDTGVLTSIVDRRIADQLRLPRRADRVFSFQKYVKVERAEFPEVQFGSVKSRQVSLFVADLSKISEFSGHADAIIGLDLLFLNKSLRINYETRTVSFFAPDDGTSDVLPLRHPQALTTRLMVQGHPVRLLIDTGLEGILLYENRLRKRVPDLKLEGQPKSARVGWMQARATTLPGVQLKSTESAISVLLTDGPAEDLLPGIDGYLGTASLEARQIEFDFEKSVLRWQ